MTAPQKLATASMLPLTLLLAAYIAGGRAATAADEAEFLQDLCDVDSGMSFCDAPVTPTVYCSMSPMAAVICDADQRIVQLSIFSYEGPFANAEITALERLRVLNFTGTNQITGSLAGLQVLPELRELRVNTLGLPVGQFGQFPALPTTAGGFPQLRLLDMSDVDYEGVLPESIASNGNLEILHLERIDPFEELDNGALPSQLGAQPLREFYLENTGFVGAIPELGQTPTLQTYHVSSSGGLTSFDDPNLLHSAALETFVLEANSALQGNLPPSLGSTTTLRVVRLVAMPLFGAGGPQLGPLLRFARGLEILEIVDIDSQQEFPADLCELTNLFRLTSVRYLVGTVPPCIDQLENLGQIVLLGTGANNCDPSQNLVGHLPAAVVEVALCGAVDEDRSAVVQDTCMNGTLPEISKPLAPLPFLSERQFFLRRNQFVSPYPDWLPLILSVPWGDQNACDFSDNRFCEKPLKGVPVNELGCTFSIDGTVNVCGQCERPDSACADCRGVVNGLARVDRCGVCAGTNDCVDCAGVVNGTSTYDACDVCSGDNSSCIDCTGVFGGSLRYDLCGVCGGDGSSCLDCAGVPYGTLEYDICDLCGGSGAACADCAGTIGGTRRRDVCGDCVDTEAEDYAPTCLDCAGTPFGTLERDECFVCGGDGSTCDPAHALAAQIAYSKLSWLFVVPIILSIILCALCIYAAARLRRRTTANASARRVRRARAPLPGSQHDEWLQRALRKRQRAEGRRLRASP